MIPPSRHFGLTCALVLALSFGMSGELRADAKASGGAVTLLHDEPGNGGGRISGGLVTAETSTGSTPGGGVSDVTAAGFQAKGGYTGQLYDPRALVLSASPGTILNEGDAALISADLTLDDDTTLTSDALDWNVVSGPATLTDGGLAIAGAVTANDSALIEAGIAGLKSSLRLNIVNLDYQANPLTWEAPAPDAGPYRVLFGIQPSSLSLVGTVTSPHYNPGQLEMGRTYYYQVFDSQNNDITPGGPGPQTFRNALFRPDLRIGKKLRATTHRGNNLYNRSGSGQTLEIALTGKRQSKSYFSVENDGDSIDHHLIRGSKARKKLKSLRYFRITAGRVNVTASAIRLGFTQRRVIPRGIILYQIQAKSRGTGTARQGITLIARSVSDTRAVDVGRAKVRSVVKKKP